VRNAGKRLPAADADFHGGPRQVFRRQMERHLAAFARLPVDPLEAAKKAYMLLQCFREHNGHHVHIQHISLEPDATFFIKGDSGSDIHDSAAHFEGESIVYKHEPNSFLNTNLLELLKGWEVERVVITGMMSSHVRGCHAQLKTWFQSHCGRRCLCHPVLNSAARLASGSSQGIYVCLAILWRCDEVR
jgi:hypothetical protein